MPIQKDLSVQKGIIMKLPITGPIIVLLFIIAIAVNNSCKKEETPKMPVLSTTAVTDITAESAESGGNIISDGGAAVTGRGICWSVNAAPSISDSKTNDGKGTGQFVSTLSGLTAGLTYHIRAYASNSAGTAYGNDISFTTSGQGPEALTQSATNITAEGATLNALVNANHLPAAVTFEYGTDLSYGQTIAADQSPVTGNTGTTVTAPVSGLAPGTTWHFRVKAVNELGTTYGNDLTFSVLGQVPEVLTQSATEITSTGATLNATVNANYLSAAVTFEYGTDLTYGQTIAADQSPVTGNTGTIVSAHITGLVPGTTCHFRVKAVNELGTAYGNDLTFTITYIVLPPSESMIIDFSNFTTGKKSAGLKGTETSAWEFAAAVSGVWSSLITKNLEIPITSFRFAKDYEPVYLGDSTWQWNYTFSANSSSYTARLIGKTRTNDCYLGDVYNTGWDWRVCRFSLVQGNIRFRWHGRPMGI